MPRGQVAFFLNYSIPLTFTLALTLTLTLSPLCFLHLLLGCSDLSRFVPVRISTSIPAWPSRARLRNSPGSLPTRGFSTRLQSTQQQQVDQHPVCRRADSITTEYRSEYRTEYRKLTFDRRHRRARVTAIQTFLFARQAPISTLRRWTGPDLADRQTDRQKGLGINIRLGQILLDKHTAG